VGNDELNYSQAFKPAINFDEDDKFKQNLILNTILNRQFDISEPGTPVSETEVSLDSITSPDKFADRKFSAKEI
jgi:hypothetical protein